MKILKLSLVLTFVFVFIFISGCSHVAAIFSPREKRVMPNPFQTIAWIKNNDPVYESGNLPLALNSPVIFQDLVFVGHNSGLLQAIELKNGRIVWQAKDEGDYHGQPQVFEDYVLYGTTEGLAVARQWSTGELVYEVDLGASVESAPTLFEGRAIFHLRNHKLICLDAKTGKILWAYQRSVPFLNTLQGVSKPLVHDGKVIVGLADGSVVALNLLDGVAQWERKVSTGAKFIDIDANPVIIANSLVLGPKIGQVHILNPVSGQILRTLEYGLARSPIIKNEKTLMPTTDGQLVIFNSEWKELAKIKISDAALSSIKIWQDHVVVSDVKGKLYVLDSKVEKVIRTFQFGHAFSAVFGEIEVSGNYLLALSSRNRLYAFNWSGVTTY